MTSEERGRLLPIGRFSQLARLSVRQLRYYHELGIPGALANRYPVAARVENIHS